MLWNGFRTDGCVGVCAELTTFPGGFGDEIHAYVARPLGEHKRSGVVVFHHGPGFDEFFQETAERLARHGYDVIVPDLYCRHGHGSPEEVYDIVRAEGGIPDKNVIADGEAARDFLINLPTSNGKVAIMGACTGGRQAMLVAPIVKGFAAVIDLWGGGVVMKEEDICEAQPVAPIDLTKDLDAPLLGVFTNEDPDPSVEMVNLHEEELKKYGKSYEFYRFDDLPHSWICYHRPRYRPEAAMETWAHIFRFLEKYLDD